MLTLTSQVHDVYKSLILHDRQINEDNTSHPSISGLHFGPHQLTADLHFICSVGKFPSVSYCGIVGSDRGIVCVRVCTIDANWQNRNDFDFGTCPTSLYLWNPATKQSKLIPKHDFDRWQNLSYGYGFDPIDDDFKVLLIVGVPNVTVVYSTTKNIWQRTEVKQNAINLFIVKIEVCVDGYLCWINQYWGASDIMVFDLNKLACCAIKGPRTSTTSYTDNVTSLNNSIVVILSEKGFNGKISLWTLNNVEHVCAVGSAGGVEASWTRLLNINVDLPLPVKFVHGNSTNGDLLLGCIDNTWFSYNSEKKEAYKIPASEHRHQVFKYTESLVSIPGSNQSAILAKMILGKVG